MSKEILGAYRYRLTYTAKRIWKCTNIAVIAVYYSTVYFEITYYVFHVDVDLWNGIIPHDFEFSSLRQSFNELHYDTMKGFHIGAKVTIRKMVTLQKHYVIFGSLHWIRTRQSWISCWF